MLSSLTWKTLAWKNIKKQKRLVFRLKALFLLKNLFCLYGYVENKEYRNRERKAGNTRNMGNVIFRGMLSNIPGNVAKYSGECHQTLLGMLPIFGVKEDNYLAESHLHHVKHPQWSSSVKISDGPNTTKKLHRRCLTGFQMCLWLDMLLVLGVDRLQLHGICSCRLVYREVVQARSN